MNRKQLTSLLIVGVVLCALGVVIYNRNAASWQSADKSTGQKVLKDFPLNDVAQIQIKEPKAELNLTKQEDQWKVKERWNYPANFTEIGDLLRKMWDLKSGQVAERKMDPVRRSFVAATGFDTTG